MQPGPPPAPPTPPTPPSPPAAPRDPETMVSDHYERIEGQCEVAVDHDAQLVTANAPDRIRREGAILLGALHHAENGDVYYEAGKGELAVRYRVGVPGQVSEFEIGRIGGAAQREVRVDIMDTMAQAASRNHLIVRIEANGRITVIDQNSTNGTFIAQKPQGEVFSSGGVIVGQDTPIWRVQTTSRQLSNALAVTADERLSSEHLVSRAMPPIESHRPAQAWLGALGDDTGVAEPEVPEVQCTPQHEQIVQGNPVCIRPGQVMRLCHGGGLHLGTIELTGPLGEGGLLLYTDPASGEQYVLEDQRTRSQHIVLGREGADGLIGPEPANSFPGIHIPEGTVSRQHICIQVIGPRVEVRDLGSSNGTFAWVGSLKDELVEQMKAAEEIQIGTETRGCNLPSRVTLHSTFPTIEAYQAKKAAQAAAQPPAARQPQQSSGGWFSRLFRGGRS